ncbi:hypothetical protein LB456_03015 [Psychroflexus sp. CAK57W]|uniref:hypothetical protein n=1 Tax=Psychroflexus curvus TaxID=2873595 RepID=UPI001CCF7396|nr:hypothetical protein [Psychroflexus curvus]MBZ9786417.1 hypothetical protein [Psychroflexus curvus]
MEMFKDLMAYYDSKELSVLQDEWNKHESHKYDNGVNVDELFEFWDKTYLPPGDIFNEPEKIKINNFSAPISEHFFLN